MLLDADTLALAPGVERLLGPEGWKPELFSCLVETNTPVCETAEEALAAITTGRRATSVMGTTSALGSNASVNSAVSRSNICAITSTPCACSSASSGERATLTLTMTATSGWSATLTSWTPIALIGRSSTIWLLVTLAPSPSSASTMSRAETEP